MKNLKVLVLVMSIVNIIGATFAYAQTGTAFLRPQFEYQKKASTIKINFSAAYVKALATGDVSCFERQGNETPNKPGAQIVRDVQDYVSNAIGRHITGDELAHRIEHNTSYRLVGREYWLTHESAYYDSATGEMMWWNPLNSSLFKDRTEWVIAYVHIGDTTVEFIANCGNLCRVKEGDSNPNDGLEQFSGQRPPYTPPATDCFISKFEASHLKIKRGQSVTFNWETSCISVAIKATDHGDMFSFKNLPANGDKTIKPRYTDDYTLTAYPGMGTKMVTIQVTTWLGRNWPFVALGLAGGGFGIYEAGKTKDHVYSTEIQGGLYPSGAGGGTGGQITRFHRLNFTLTKIFYIK